MSLGWEQTRRRFRLVQTTLDAVAQARRPELPAALRAEVEAEFGDLGGFLGEVARRWYRTFDARLDELLERESGDRSALRRLVREVDDALPGARLVLDAHEAHPALVDLREHHRRSLLAATGIDRYEPRDPMRSSA
jgi:hypothetical protein